MRRSVLLLLPLAACATYDQRRVALVPHLAPVMTTGQPQPTRVALGAGAPALTDLSEPSLTDSDAGVGVPRRTTRVMFSVALKPNMSISAIRDVGTGHRPYSFDPMLKLDGSDLEGRGLQWDYSFRTSDPHFRVGLAVEMMYWIVPWVGVDTCISDCEYADPGAYLWGDDFVATLGVAVAPSYRITENLTVFGNLTARNHPTLRNAVTTIGHEPVEVQGGPFSVLVAGGMALELDRHLELALQIAQALTDDPVGYGPSISGWLRVGFGSSEEPPRRPLTMYVQPAQPPPT